MKKNHLILTAASIFISIAAEASFSLTCHQRNEDEKLLISNTQFTADSAPYSKSDSTSLAFPKIGNYAVNDTPDVRMIVSQAQVEFPTIEDVGFRIETDDTWSTINVQDVFQVNFDRVSTTTKFSAIVTQFEGDGSENPGPFTYDASCELIHL